LSIAHGIADQVASEVKVHETKTVPLRIRLLANSQADAGLSSELDALAGDTIDDLDAL
jgi:hypothetical protein